jgi:hypothetical protein
VRPTLEYGCEIWGNGLFGSIEDTQLLMGRKILRGGKRLTSEVVLGELGWESHKARRDELRLRFWEKLLNLPEHNITKKIYLESKKRLEEELRQGGEITPTWCFYTKKLLEDLDLSNHWEKQSTSDPEKKEIQDKWDRIIRGKIHQREEKAWRASCLERPKLRTYVQLKTLLCYESYLNHYRLRTSELVRLRGGSSRLRIEQGRYAKEKVEERICKFCDEGKVEDEAPRVPPLQGPPRTYVVIRSVLRGHYPVLFRNEQTPPTLDTDRRVPPNHRGVQSKYDSSSQLYPKINGQA